MDFHRIRVHKGDQKTGFEEFICQLARVEKPQNASNFVRKGAGGDGGVECYWSLEDESETGWQAKYFLTTLGNSEFRQIEESFKTTIEKHPKLTIYVVAIPRDLSDSRAKRKGKPVVTERDRWNAQKRKLEDYAEEHGRAVVIEEWFESELLSKLNIDSPEHRGMQIYWFQKDILTIECFENIYKRNKDSLGERYTPSDHVELKISQNLSSHALDKNFTSDLQSKLSSLIKTLGDTGNEMQRLEEEGLKNLQTQLVQLLRTSHSDLEKSIGELSELATSGLEDGLAQILSDLPYSSETRNLRYRLEKKLGHLRDFSSFLKSPYFRSASQGRLLITGDAGTGKSHMLCDYYGNSLTQKGLAIFLLGQHYPGGSPLDWIKKECDVATLTDTEFLGALSSLANAIKSPIPIVIDALNEGPHNEDWKNHLVSLNSTLSSFPPIRLVVSCRSTYQPFVIPDENLETLGWPKVEHRGFSGTEQEAVEAYFGNRNIVPPILPFYPAQFSNPLLLKTFAQLLQNQGHNRVPDGLIGLSTLFEALVTDLEKKISIKKRVNHEEKACSSALAVFAEKLFPNQLFGMPVQEARTTINAADPNPSYGDPLFNLLIEEGTLCNDYSPTGDLVTRFAYERFTDQFVTKTLLRRAEERTEEGGSTSESINAILTPLEVDSWKLTGILTILSISVAEKHGEELLDAFSEDSEYFYIIKEHVFFEDLLWRRHEHVSERTIEIFESFRTSDSFQSDFFNHLLCLSTRPEHPLNAEYLHNILAEMDLPSRDEEWSTHIAVDGAFFEENETPNTWKLIRWARDLNTRECGNEMAQLAAITLSWMLSAPNRKVRDHATKSLARLFFSQPEIIAPILEKFWEVNDPYVTERVVLAAYGACCRTDDHESIRQVAHYLISVCFSTESPPANIILRDSAKGIVLLAKRLGLTDISESKISAPFSTGSPIEIPSEDDIDALEGDNFSDAVKSSLMGHPGDFGNYSMSSVTKWSTTPIRWEKPLSVKEIQEFALAKLSDGNREIFASFLESKKRDEENQNSLAWFVANSRNESRPSQNETNEEAEEEFNEEEIKRFLKEEAEEEFDMLGYYALSAPSDRAKPIFSKTKAQRWVCKRVHELGWTNDRFHSYENNYVGYSSRSRPTLERVGKKYQWIAYYEFLAHLSDQYCFIDPGYSDVTWDKYVGPWQISERNLDPTEFKGVEENIFSSDSYPALKHPIDPQQIVSLSEWFSGSRIFDDITQWITHTIGNVEWVCLGGFQKASVGLGTEDTDEVRLDEWFRIHSCIVSDSDLPSMKSSLEGEWLGHPDVLEPPGNSHDGFLYEYPWHPFYHERPHEKWFSTAEARFTEESAPVAHLPLFEYFWEFADSDHSSDESHIHHFLPSPKLIDALSLVHSKEDPALWTTEDGIPQFYSSTADDRDAPLAWITKDALINWLNKTKSTLILTIGGEKNVYEGRWNKAYKRKNLNALCSLKTGSFEINQWENEEGDLTP